jgi:hypothetical protein
MIVGRTSKAPSETKRVTVDFSQWLDTAEVVGSITTPVVALQPTSYPGPFPYPASVVIPTEYPDDPTPLLVSGAFIISPDSLLVRLFATAGTDGNGYSITFRATGSTSGRIVEVRVDMSVRNSSVRVL